MRLSCLSLSVKQTLERGTPRLKWRANERVHSSTIDIDELIITVENGYVIIKPNAEFAQVLLLHNRELPTKEWLLQ